MFLYTTYSRTVAAIRIGLLEVVNRVVQNSNLNNKPGHIQIRTNPGPWQIDFQRLHAGPLCPE